LVTGSHEQIQMVMLLIARSGILDEESAVIVK